MDNNNTKKESLAFCAWQQSLHKAKSPRDISFHGIPKSVADSWKGRIADNLPSLGSSQSFDELYGKLCSQRFKGIGEATIQHTIEWFLAHYENIDRESNCSCLFLSKTQLRLTELGCSTRSLTSIRGHFNEFDSSALEELVFKLNWRSCHELL